MELATTLQPDSNLDAVLGELSYETIAANPTLFLIRISALLGMPERVSVLQARETYDKRIALLLTPPSSLTEVNSDILDAVYEGEIDQQAGFLTEYAINMLKHLRSASFEGDKQESAYRTRLIVWHEQLWRQANTQQLAQQIGSEEGTAA